MSETNPLNLGHFWVIHIGVTIEILQQVMMDSLMYPLSLRDKPVVNGSQFSDNLAFKARLLPHFTLGGDIMSFTRFHMALRHRPQYAATTIQTPNKSNMHFVEVDSSIGGNRVIEARQCEATGGCFNIDWQVVTEVPVRASAASAGSGVGPASASIRSAAASSVSFTVAALATLAFVVPTAAFGTM